MLARTSSHRGFARPVEYVQDLALAASEIDAASVSVTGHFAKFVFRDQY